VIHHPAKYLQGLGRRGPRLATGGVEPTPRDVDLRLDRREPAIGLGHTGHLGGAKCGDGLGGMKDWF